MHKRPNFVLLAFTLEAELQRMLPPKEPRWHHFQEVMAPRVRPLEPSIGRAKCSTQTSVKRPNFFQRLIILIYFFSPKTYPLDIVWYGKVTLLLSTWAQCEPALSWGLEDRNTTCSNLRLEHSFPHLQKISLLWRSLKRLLIVTNIKLPIFHKHPTFFYFIQF